MPSGIKNYDYIFANLPYVPSDYPVAPEVMAEPRRAVFAGYHGLALIKKLAPVAGQRLKPGGLIFIESLPEQQAAILDYYQNSGFKYLKKYDLVQLLIRN